MSYEYKSKLTTKYNPSVIEYSSAYDVFICGTYHLHEDQSAGDTIDDTLKDTLKRVNNRFGNLLLITRDNRMVEEHECFDGGVFDLKLIPWDGVHDCPLVCHSNGFVAIYRIDCSLRLQSVTRYGTNCSLLTCLATTHVNHTIVGNSDGRLVFVDMSSMSTSMTTHLSVTKSCEPIWTLFCAIISDNYVLFVGSDDSLWRVYCLPQSMSSEVLSALAPKYVNRDSNAGITCFASNECSDNILSLIVGSYDEWIRYYSVQLTSNECQINVSLKHKLHIDGSGIWRVILRPGYSNRQLVSGMYSGAHLLIDGQLDQTLQPSDTTDDENALIYGVNCDLNLNDILMASFYGRTVYLFSKS